MPSVNTRKACSIGAWTSAAVVTEVAGSRVVDVSSWIGWLAAVREPGEGLLPELLEQLRIAARPAGSTE